MTNKGHAVTNPRISAGATVVRSPRLPWGSGFVPTSSHDLEGGEFCLLDFKQPYQRRRSAAAASTIHPNEAAGGRSEWLCVSNLYNRPLGRTFNADVARFDHLTHKYLSLFRYSSAGVKPLFEVGC